MSTALSTAPAKPSGALAIMAARLNIEPEKMKATLKATVFKECKNDEELAALVVVSNEYRLNPLLREIFAFSGKGGGIVPLVSVDGWVKLVNNHPQMDGLEFDFHEANGQLTAVTCTIYRKDRTRPIKVTEYLSECRRNTEPWKMEHRMLRHKALKECARYAFGFSGIYDEDEAEEIRDVTPPGPAIPQRNPFASAPVVEAPPVGEPAPPQEPEAPPQAEEPADFTLDPYAGGTIAYFEDVRVVQSPATAARKWTRYDIRYTIAGGPERTTGSFSNTVGDLVSNFEGGEKICLWIETKGQNSNITKLALVEEGA
jgi:hypothetical protein